MNYMFFLLAAICLYVALIRNMRSWKAHKLIDLAFAAAIFLPYITEAFIVYSDVGFYDWNFQNILPVANVSPFMFFISPLALFLPEKPKQQLLLLFSLLSALRW